MHSADVRFVSVAMRSDSTVFDTHAAALEARDLSQSTQQLAATPGTDSATGCAIFLPKRHDQKRTDRNFVTNRSTLFQSCVGMATL